MPEVAVVILEEERGREREGGGGWRGVDVMEGGA